MIQLATLCPAQLGPAVVIAAAVDAGGPVLCWMWEGVDEKQINAEQLVVTVPNRRTM
jgi:hypothetical protein